MIRIPAPWRLALLAKAALLLSLGAVFVGLAVALVASGSTFRIALGVPALLPAAFCGWNGLRALLDAVLGRAVEVHGAIPLASRRSGYSLRLPDGRFAEFVLWNPWGPLDAGRQYSLLLGRYSGVIVAEPRAR